MTATPWLQRSTPRWRVVFGVVLVGLLIAVVTAVFTTFDSIEAGETRCGSPLQPATATPRCNELLDHARSTRVAGLAWALVLGALLVVVWWRGHRAGGQ